MATKDILVNPDFMTMVNMGLVILLHTTLHTDFQSTVSTNTKVLKLTASTVFDFF